MLFLAPIAVAGYVYWDKKRKEQMENEGQGESCEKATQEATDGNSTTDSEETTWNIVREATSVESSQNADDAMSMSSVEEDRAAPKAQQEKSLAQSEQDKTLACTQNNDVPAKVTREPPQASTTFGPIARFNKFRTNLKKEFEKAEARKQAQQAAMMAEMAKVQQIENKPMASLASEVETNIPAIKSQ